MKLWIGGEIDSTAADDFRSARAAVEASINTLVSEIDAADANEWDVIAILRDDDLFQERIRFSKQGGMDLRLRISLREFLSGSPAARINLLVDMLLRSLDVIEKQYPEISNMERVRKLVLGIRQNA